MGDTIPLVEITQEEPDETQPPAHVYDVTELAIPLLHEGGAKLSGHVLLPRTNMVSARWCVMFGLASRLAQVVLIVGLLFFQWRIGVVESVEGPVKAILNISKVKLGIRDLEITTDLGTFVFYQHVLFGRLVTPSVALLFISCVPFFIHSQWRSREIESVVELKQSNLVRRFVRFLFSLVAPAVALGSTLYAQINVSKNLNKLCMHDRCWRTLEYGVWFGACCSLSLSLTSRIFVYAQNCSFHFMLRRRIRELKLSGLGIELKHSFPGSELSRAEESAMNERIQKVRQDWKMRKKRFRFYSLLFFVVFAALFFAALAGLLGRTSFDLLRWKSAAFVLQNVNVTVSVEVTKVFLDFRSVSLATSSVAILQNNELINADFIARHLQDWGDIGMFGRSFYVGCLESAGEHVTAAFYLLCFGMAVSLADLHRRINRTLLMLSNCLEFACCIAGLLLYFVAALRFEACNIRYKMEVHPGSVCVLALILARLAFNIHRIYFRAEMARLSVAREWRYGTLGALQYSLFRICGIHTCNAVQDLVDQGQFRNAFVWTTTHHFKLSFKDRDAIPGYTMIGILARQGLLNELRAMCENTPRDQIDLPDPPAFTWGAQEPDAPPCFLGLARTPLHHAACRGHIEAGRILLQYGCPTNLQDVNLESPLHLASSRGMVELLLAHGASVHIQGRYGTPLFTLAHIPGCVPLLLAHGADVNRRNLQNQTALHFACSIASFESVVALVGAGADVDVRDNAGRTPLFLAAANDRLGKITEFLLNRGISAESCDGRGNYPIEVAQVDPVRRMLRADKNSAEIEQLIRDEDVEGLRNLLGQEKSRSILNNVDDKGRFILSIATLHGKATAAACLLELGCNPHYVHRGLSSLLWAKWRGQEDLIKLLESRQCVMTRAEEVALQIRDYWLNEAEWPASAQRPLPLSHALQVSPFASDTRACLTLPSVSAGHSCHPSTHAPDSSAPRRAAAAQANAALTMFARVPHQSLFAFLTAIGSNPEMYSPTDKPMAEVLQDTCIFVCERVALQKPYHPVMIAVVYLYTYDCDIFRKSNLAMREQVGLEAWQPWIFYLSQCLDLLPSQKCTVYRGVGIRLLRSGKQIYDLDQEISWTSFSSTSMNPVVAKDEFSKKGQGTFFVLEIHNGKDISDFSSFICEREILLLPHTKFKVKNFFDVNQISWRNCGDMACEPLQKQTATEVENSPQLCIRMWQTDK